MKAFGSAGLAIFAAAITLATSALAQQPNAPSSSVSSISVVGTEIVVALADGRALRSKDLVGATLNVRFEGQPARVRISGVELDPGDKSGTVWLHTFEGQQADGTFSNLCSAGPDGRTQGFPLQDAAGGLEFTCSSGAIGR